MQKIFQNYLILINSPDTHVEVIALSSPIIIVGKIDSEINSFHKITNIEITNSIAEIMVDIDLMIIGSGLIRYEAVFMEIPSIIFSLKSEHNEMVEFFTKYGSEIGIIIFHSSALPSCLI